MAEELDRPPCENVRLGQIEGAGIYESEKFLPVYRKHNRTAGVYVNDVIYSWKRLAVTNEEKREEDAAWHLSPAIGIGVPVMMNTIDSLYSTAGFLISGSCEWFKPRFGFFRIGLNLEAGLVGYDTTMLKQIPGVDSVDGIAGFIKGGAFVKLYPADVFYLSGGVNVGYYGSSDGMNDTGKVVFRSRKTISAVFPVGVGIVIGPKDLGTVLDAQYNIAKLPPNNTTVVYWTFNLAVKFGRKRLGT